MKKRLSEVLEQAIIKIASGIDEDHDGNTLPWDGLEPKDWKKLHAKWNRFLSRMGIERTKVGTLHRDQNAAHEEFDPQIQGMISVIDPLTESRRTRGYRRLDIPEEIADRMVVLGFTP